jgi:proline iminopeptidase
MESTQGYVPTDDGVRLFFETVGTGAQRIVIPNGFYLVDDFKLLTAGRTLIFYDVRNRGRSDTVTAPSQLARGIHNDVDDLEAVRRHFGLDKLNLIGHSYMGLMAILYAMKYGPHVNRIVQIGPMGPYPDKQYPAPLSYVDEPSREVFAKVAELQKERASHDPEAFCRKFWSALRLLYVTDPADADKINWGRCDLANERNFMRYWMGTILPSIHALALNPDDLAKVTAPVLTLHGTKDRSAPYGGGKDWASLLANARLVTVDNAGHAPWIEAPQAVFASIGRFIDGL